MRSRDRDQSEWESFEPAMWLDADVEGDDSIVVDDEEFARAIAEGRRAVTAA